MKYLLATALLFTIVTLTHAQSTEAVYDSTLAAQLGADDYGMKWYTLVILKTGENDVQDPELRAKLFAGHFENMNAMAEAGKLIVAGPFAQNDQAHRGIFIIDTEDPNEAQALLQNDPTISEKVFTAELFKWYGSAALREHLPVHDAIQKTTIK